MGLMSDFRFCVATQITSVSAVGARAAADCPTRTHGVCDSSFADSIPDQRQQDSITLVKVLDPV